jgi:hypothetical protein
LWRFIRIIITEMEINVLTTLLHKWQWNRDILKPLHFAGIIRSFSPRN